MKINSDFKNRLTGHILGVIGSGSGEASRFVGGDSQSLGNGKELASHSKNACVAAKG
jgi:hypothetical protein